MTKNDFILEMTKMGIELNDLQIDQFERYVSLLQDWNNKINLTAIIKTEDVYLKHFYDSATLVKVVDFTKINNLCDVGTGAGFPGVVLKILFPNIKLVLVDSLNKRLTFLKEVVRILNLSDVEFVHERAEIFSIKRREEFDVITARAVAKLNVLMEYCVPLLKVNGLFIALKGTIDQELNDSKNALILLGCKINKIEKLYLPKENSLRNLIVIEKQKKTSKTYPRSNKEIEAKPL